RMLAVTRELAGDATGARRAAEELVSRTSRGPSWWLVETNRLAGLVVLHRGDPPRLLDEVDPAAVECADPSSAAWLSLQLARRAVTARRPEAAREWVERGRSRSGELGLPLVEARTLVA